MIKSDRFEKIKKSEEIQNYLELIYDFTLTKLTTDTLKLGFKTDLPVTCFGRDACGGIYVLVGAEDQEERPIAYISSEGEAGYIAKSFDSYIEMIINMPFWVDVLKFSGGGKIEEMTKAYHILQKEVEKDMDEVLEDEEDDRNYKAVQTFMKKSLGIAVIENPVQILHDAAKMTPAFLAYSKKDQTPYGSLFNQFVVSDNPAWKNKK